MIDKKELYKMAQTEGWKQIRELLDKTFSPDILKKCETTDGVDGFWYVRGELQAIENLLGIIDGAERHIEREAEKRNAGKQSQKD